MKTFTLALLLLAVPAYAETRFLVYGDSVANEGAANCTDWGCRLAVAKPALGVLCRSAVPGRTTTDGLANTTGGLGFNFAYCAAGGHSVANVYIALSLNDLCTLTPEQSATNLMTLASRVVGYGSTPHVVTPTPALSFTNCLGADWDKYRREVTAWVRILNAGTYDVIEASDLVFAKAVWLACSSDGVHPSGTAGQSCRQAIANAASVP